MTDTKEQSAIHENPFRTSRLNHSSNFDARWDVESLNAAPSKWILDDISRTSGRRESDPGQLIPVILSASGYGKTHILGRLGSALKGKALFAFIGIVPDPKRLLDHVRWTVVETLFREESGNPSPLACALAELFLSSFVEHAVKYCPDPHEKQMLLDKFDEGVPGVLEVIKGSSSFNSYQKLAMSAAARIPHVRSTVMRALALGWSPRKHLARQWLRGEKLSEDDARLIGIFEESPNAVDVLNGVVAVLDYKKPLVICFDQIESILKDPEGPRQLGTQLMELLAGVPNQYLLISCFQDAWFDHYRHLLPPGFLRRSKEHELKFPSPEQALELVKKRLQGLSGYDPAAGELWPFDGAKLEKFVRDEKPMPSQLILRCAAAMDAWMAGEATAPLTISEEIQSEQALPQLFAMRWNEEFQNVSRDPRRQPDEMQDARIFSAMKEMVALAKSAGAGWPELHVSAVKESVLSSTPAYPRYGMRVEVADPAGVHSVIAGVTTMTGGNGLFYFIREMGKAIKTAAGGVLLHPRGEFTLGQVGGNTVAKLKADKKLVILFLKDHRPMFAAMECALGLLEQSRSGELVLGAESISYEQCQRLMCETKVLDDLHFFKVLAEWNATASEPSVAPARDVARRPASASRAAAAI